MKPIRLIQSIVASSLLVLASQVSFAAKASSIVCPTSEQLKSFKFSRHLDTMAMDFDAESQRVKYFIQADQDHSSDDDYLSNWSLFSSSLSAGQNEDLVALLDTTLEQMVPTTPTAFQSEISIENDIKLEAPICIYTIPGNNHFSAILSYFSLDNMPPNDDENGDDIPDDDSDNDDYLAKNRVLLKHHKQHIAQILKHHPIKHG
jgi:hypothetical protein